MFDCYDSKYDLDVDLSLIPEVDDIMDDYPPLPCGNMFFEPIHDESKFTNEALEKQLGIKDGKTWSSMVEESERIKHPSLNLDLKEQPPVDIMNIDISPFNNPLIKSIKKSEMWPSWQLPRDIYSGKQVLTWAFIERFNNICRESNHFKHDSKEKAILRQMNIPQMMALLEELSLDIKNADTINNEVLVIKEWCGLSKTISKNLLIVYYKHSGQVSNMIDSCSKSWSMILENCIAKHLSNQEKMKSLTKDYRESVLDI